uniref:helix-turn-helix transcriptional regulator n=1 Tax=Gemmiger formicilis TaxID=745368 RepID=UPI00402861D3
MDICQVAALRIRKMRLEKNMTIDDLAEKCDVSTQTIKLIEAGRRYTGSEETIPPAQHTDN